MFDLERRLLAIERFMREIRGDRGATEPATWTPTLLGTSTAGSFTYTVQVGYYVRIGDIVLIQGDVAISAIGVAPVGTMRIGGLPVAAANISNLFGTIHFGYIDNINFAASALMLTGVFNPNTTEIRLVEVFDNSGAVDMPAANFTNANARLIFSGHYQA